MEDNVEPTNSEIQELLLQLEQANFRFAAANATFEKVRDARQTLSHDIDEERRVSSTKIYDWRIELQKRIEEEQQRLEDALRDKQAELTRLEAERYDALAAKRNAEAEAESLQRQLDAARRAAMQKAEWATLEQRWDLMTMGAPWREWAKDHQILGGKKMTYEGRLILGDTMGLGKTLTSLIAIDMIEAATKDASPDNPVEFGSK